MFTKFMNLSPSSENLRLRQTILPVLTSAANTTPSQLTYTRLPSVADDGTARRRPENCEPQLLLLRAWLSLRLRFSSTSLICQAGLSSVGSSNGPVDCTADATATTGCVVARDVLSEARWSAASTSLPPMVIRSPAN